MRTDPELDPSFTNSSRWHFTRGLGGSIANVRENKEGAESKWTAYSHSGNERNRVFLNLGNANFADVSGVSGADSIADGRACVIWDPDRDGRPDLALANANQPALQLFSNRSAEAIRPNGFIALRICGANHTPHPAPGSSTRDAIGTEIRVTTEKATILRVLSAGEGFASQNSKVCLIGIGPVTEAALVEVILPSGRVLSASGVPAGTLLTIDEATGQVTPSPYCPAEREGDQ